VNKHTLHSRIPMLIHTKVRTCDLVTWDWYNELLATRDMTKGDFANRVNPFETPSYSAFYYNDKWKLPVTQSDTFYTYCAFYISLSYDDLQKHFYSLLFRTETYTIFVNVFNMLSDEFSVWSDIRHYTFQINPNCKNRSFWQRHVLKNKKCDKLIWNAY